MWSIPNEISQILTQSGFKSLNTGLCEIGLLLYHSWHTLSKIIAIQRKFCAELQLCFRMRIWGAHQCNFFLRLCVRLIIAHHIKCIHQSLQRQLWITMWKCIFNEKSVFGHFGRMIEAVCFPCTIITCSQPNIWTSRKPFEGTYPS